MIARYTRNWISSGGAVPLLVSAASFTFYLFNLAPNWLLAAVQGNIGRSLSVISLAQQLFMHLIFPISWYHHLTMTFVAFSTLIERWRYWRRPSREMLALIAACSILAIHGLPWHRLVARTLLFDLATWAEIMLFGLLFIQLRKYSSAQQTAPTTLQTSFPQPQG